jgi:hypothetical protein
MSDAGPPPRDCAELDARSPEGGTWKLLLRARKVQTTARKGMGAARELGYTVPWALQNPTAIFRGVREEGEASWLCYVSRPTRVYDHRTGELRQPWSGQVFLVFVNNDRIIYNWRWEKADAADPNLPENAAVRFEERVL